MAEILVVDDDHDTADTLADVIGMEGHEVRVAYNGLEGLRALDARLPDLVVIDVEMPQLDGPGMAYGMLVEDLGREKIPIVISSGVVDLPTVAARVGTPYYVQKPVSLPALMSVLARALVEHRAPSTDGPSA